MRKLFVMIRFLLITALVAGAAVGLATGASSWDWPAEMVLGGFTVTGISGTVNADNSGSATGSVLLPGLPNQKTTLSRSSGGDISGAVTVSARMYGAEMQGNFNLDAGGLKCRNATFRVWPKPVIEANVTVSTGGQFAGSGRVPLGNVSVPVKFTSSSSQFDLDGSTSIQIQTDTDLATYTFSGDLKLEGVDGRLAMTAKGSVQRAGKLSNQVSTTRVSDVQVNPTEGTGTVSVEGVNVTFSFFKP